jgi:glycosyltransferase involved in cell wall biosynthesis
MFEAMAAERSILLAVDGEARATLERAAAGLYVPPGDATALASAIRHLAADAGARARMGAAAGEFVEREFSRRVWARRYLGILSRLLVTADVKQPVTSPALEQESR